MRGIIDKVWASQAKDGTPYRVLVIGGEKYSLWDTKYFNHATEGAEVEYDVKESGEFRNITRLGSANAIEPDIPTGRDLRIMRTSALKCATEIAAGYRSNYDETVERTLELANRFEKYIHGDIEGSVLG